MNYSTLLTVILHASFNMFHFSTSYKFILSASILSYWGLSEHRIDTTAEKLEHVCVESRTYKWVSFHYFSLYLFLILCRTNHVTITVTKIFAEQIIVTPVFVKAELILCVGTLLLLWYIMLSLNIIVIIFFPFFHDVIMTLTVKPY